jgi:DNA-binding PadR family transcriptional regulator
MFRKEATVDADRFDNLAEGLTAVRVNRKLSELQIAILAALLTEPTHGWDLLRAVRRIYQETNCPNTIAASTLYKNIDFLKDMGLVREVETGVGVTNRTKSVIGLTEEGRKAAFLATEHHLQQAQALYGLVHGAPA